VTLLNSTVTWARRLNAAQLSVIKTLHLENLDLYFYLAGHRNPVPLTSIFPSLEKVHIERAITGFYSYPPWERDHADLKKWIVGKFEAKEGKEIGLVFWDE
jgi:hypothetical protein